MLPKEILPSNLRAVIFDLGGTLLHFDYPFISAEFQKIGFNISQDDFYLAVARANHEIERQMQQGLGATDAARLPIFFNALLREIHAPVESEKFIDDILFPRHQEMNLWNYVQDGTIELLKALREKYRVAMISNSDGRAEQKTIQFGLREHLEFVIDSHYVDVEKPDARIFEMACEKLNLPASACVYVGDIYSIDVVGAANAKMSAVLLDRTLPNKTDCIVLSSVFELPNILI
jgi:HAD superfamily hydrolase (TIGR01549 family)